MRAWALLLGLLATPRLGFAETGVDELIRDLRSHGRTEDANVIQEWADTNRARNKAVEDAAKQRILTYKPDKTIPFEAVTKVVAHFRELANQGDHSICLFDTRDNCFLRNMMFKDELRKLGHDIDKATASAIIVESGPGGKWSFHTVAVIYTERGPFVFDPDNKSGDQVYDGDLLTPLDQWLKVKWNFEWPVTMLAPPGFIDLDDFAMPDEFNSPEEFTEFWNKYRGLIPSDRTFKTMLEPMILSSRIEAGKKLCPALPPSSAKNFEEHRRRREPVRGGQ